jgi:hypothetical protein
MERGVTTPVADPAGVVRGTNTNLFVRDRDPATKTNALRKDTDGDGWSDGREDNNPRNGRLGGPSTGETNPLRRDTGDGKIDSRDPRPRYP